MISMLKITKFVFFIAPTCLLSTTMYGDQCTIATANSPYLSIAVNHAKYYTVDGDSCSDSDPIGENCIWFPTSSQATNTKLKVRPRNNGCTYTLNGFYVFNSEGGGVKFHDNPYCDDNDTGYWQYEVPTADKILTNTYNHTADYGTTDQQVTENGTTLKINFTYIAVAWGSLITLASNNCHHDGVGIECYNPYVVYDLPTDTATYDPENIVYLSEICSN